MKKLIVLFIILLTVSSLAFSQFVLEQPVIEFDVDFGNNSLGILRYYGFRVSEDEFWYEAVSSSIFYNLIDPSETLILPSFTLIEDNSSLDDYIKSTMRRYNINVCITLYSNIYDGFTYMVNYSFDNFKTFGFISMDSTGYVSPFNRSETQPPVTTSSLFTVVTGRVVTSNVTEEELLKRINLQSYNDIVSWLRWNSNNYVESTGVQHDRLVNVLVNNFKFERSAAENTIRNIGNYYKFK